MCERFARGETLCEIVASPILNAPITHQNLMVKSGIQFHDEKIVDYFSTALSFFS
jgi:hypothetical protein